ncbi:MAG: UDP-3-O-(3-hydroxymyristoyl)glucosamine N-acyltransferase [Phycisphaeraceae bacterium]|nr:UDP-3-O-(3-hydroxymyristoyl)glucosamine N-acyltransferase [Phycisphaeraceae bacterium]
MSSYTASQICQRVGGRLTGDAEVLIEGVEILGRAQARHVTFIRDARHAAEWAQSSAGAVLVADGVDVQPIPSRAVIHVPEADLAMAIMLDLFALPRPLPKPGVHPSAVVDPSAQLGPGVAIGPHCTVGARVNLGRGVVLHANVVVLDDCVLGEKCELFPGVVVRERCELGCRVVIHSNAVIGADGFGYRASPDGKGVVKIPHIGFVRLGNDVEIGAGTCIDRGKLSPTTIGDGTKIDNLCQIAHNCEIGRMCLIAGQVGIAGSVTVGDGVRMGGKVAIRDNVTIGSGANLAACSAIMGDVPEGKTWGGYPARDAGEAMREIAMLKKLPDLVKMLKHYERERAGAKSRPDAARSTDCSR